MSMLKGQKISRVGYKDEYFKLLQEVVYLRGFIVGSADFPISDDFHEGYRACANVIIKQIDERFNL